MEFVVGTNVSRTEEDTGAKTRIHLEQKQKSCNKQEREWRSVSIYRTETHRGTNLYSFPQLSPYCYLFHALHLHVFVCVYMCVSSTGHLHGMTELTHALGAVRVRACSVAGAIHGAATGQRGSARTCQSSHTG